MATWVEKNGVPNVSRVLPRLCTRVCRDRDRARAHGVAHCRKQRDVRDSRRPHQHRGHAARARRDDRDCAGWTGIAHRHHGGLVRLGSACRRGLPRLAWVQVSARADPARIPAPRMGFFWQGFLVLMSNPKALLLFGAFIPQFVDPTGDYVRQVLILGVTAMAVAGIFDSGYAVLTGRVRTLLSPARARLLSRLSGGCLIGGGVWLALARSR